MLKAADIMTKAVVKIRGTATLAEAVQVMKKKGCRALIVDRRHQQDAYGIVTETDIVYKVIALGKDPHTVRVHEVMTKPCIVINPDLGVEYVARLFAEHKLLRAPVIQGELLGMISISDILNKTPFIEQPQTRILEQELQNAIRTAREICAEQGHRSESCIVAWNQIEELQSELAHQQTEKLLKTAFEEYCEEFPQSLESSIYENLCSG